MIMKFIKYLRFGRNRWTTQAQGKRLQTR
jgi:hypothetical protein